MGCLLIFMFVTLNVVPFLGKFEEKQFQTRNSTINLIVFLDSENESEDDLTQSDENLIFHRTTSSTAKVASGIHSNRYLKVIVKKNHPEKLFIDFGALII